MIEDGKDDGPKQLQEKYELPDGTTVMFGIQAIDTPEVLFDPNMIGNNNEGVHQMLNNCIRSCDIGIRKVLYNNIHISGGSTMFPNIDRRLKNELESMVGPNVKVEIKASQSRKFSVWEGCALLAKLDDFKNYWITRKEWEDGAAQIILKKCI